MAFPTTSVIDDFDRGDSATLGANWTEGDIEPDGPGGTNLQIVSNKCDNIGFLSASGRWNVETFGPNCEVFATVDRTPGVDDRYFLHARIVQPGTSTFDGYSLCLKNISSVLNFILVRWDNGSRTDIATQAVTFNTGDKMGLEIIGSALKGYRYNGSTWSEEISQTDTNHGAAGYIGVGDSLIVSDYGILYNDFGGGTVVSGGSAIPIILQHME